MALRFSLRPFCFHTKTKAVALPVADTSVANGTMVHLSSISKSIRLSVLALLSWHRAAATQAHAVNEPPKSRQVMGLVLSHSCGCGVLQVGSTRLDVSTEALQGGARHNTLRWMGGAAATVPGLVGKGAASVQGGAAVQGRRLDAVRPRRHRCAPCRRVGKRAGAELGRSLSLEGAEAAVATGAKVQGRRGDHGRGCDGATGRRCRTARRQSDGKCDATCRADARCYAARYPDLGLLWCVDGSPCLFAKLLNHFHQSGRKEGRAYHCSCDATCKVDARCYAARYPDLGSLFCAVGSPCHFVKLLNHYHANGRREGRTFHCPPTLSERCERLSSWTGTAEGRSLLKEALSCHINASGMPHDVELRDAFCTSSNKKQLSTPPAFISAPVLVHDSAGCDLHSLGAHLEAQGQLQATCSDPPAAAASFSSDVRHRVESSLGIAEGGLQRQPVLSVVVLIFRNTIKLWLMLDSLSRQQTSFPYEVVIADNGCDSGIASLVSRFEAKMAETNTSVRYLAICTNIGYAAGNNAGVASASTNSTEHLLFLNDDIELMPRFIQSLYELMTTRSRPIGPGAVGCKIVSQNGSSLLEAGSIMWADGSALGYGRGSRPDAPEVSFVRPVDYISGACLLVPRAHFVRLGGFEVAAYKAYYEDTDLQMRIRYELNQTIWYQPLAVARHHEHGSFGTSAMALMQAGAVTFRNRWGRVLDASHRSPTNDPVGVMRASDRRLDSLPAVLYIDVLLPRQRRGSGLPRALDNVLSLARLGYKVTVLGTDEPAAVQASLSSAGLHLLGQIPAEYDTWTQLRQAGVEVVRYEDVQRAVCEDGVHDAPDLQAEDECAVVRLLFRLRPRYYAAIITSRPTEWRKCYTHLAAYCNKPDRLQHKVGVDGVAGTCTCPSGAVFEVGAMEGSNGTELACSGGNATLYSAMSRMGPNRKVRRRHASRPSTTAAPTVLGMGADCSAVAPTSSRPTCTLLYDAEALWFRRDERMITAADRNKTSPATGQQVTAARSHNSLARSKELSLLYTADVIITVSNEEERYIKGVVSTPVVVVGHSPPAAAISAVPFESRSGILLIAGFNGEMYYNGDAAWYLVTQIYPLIAQAALRNRDPPIPLTIAGSGIPQDLVAVVNASIYREHIRLEYSPRSLTPLYDAARLTIIPHQYGCGTQYKLSEAMAIGLPAAVSPLASDGIGVTGGVSEQVMLWSGDFDKPLCVGATTEQLATCAVRLHSDKQLWTQLRKGALHFSREIQSGDLWTRQLSQAVRTGLAQWAG